MVMVINSYDKINHIVLNMLIMTDRSDLTQLPLLAAI